VSVLFIKKVYFICIVSIILGSIPGLTLKSTSSAWERDDSSDSSRRSTPAPLPPPPPAHQRTTSLPVRSQTPSHQSSMSCPVDLSAPLDLSEVQDFSMSKKSTNAPQNKGKLDDMLSKLMKRKNVVSASLF
jgi:hypothetical protein